MASRADLIAALESVKGAVAQKTFVPILTHVYINDNIVLGYDSELGVRVTLEKGIGVTFNAKFDLLLDLMKHLEAEQVEFEVEGKKVHIKCGNHDSFLTQIVDEKFPVPDVMPKSDAWQTVPAGFKEALERALFATSQNEQAKELAAVCVRDNRVFGTDGKRAVRCTLEGMTMPPTLLGKRAAEEVIRLGNPARLAHADPWLVFDYHNLTLLARLREGASIYPPVDVLFDKIAAAAKPLPIGDGLNGALNRLRLFVEGLEMPSVTIKFTELLTELIAVNVTHEAHEYLDVAEERGNDKSFNPKLLLEGLSYAEHLDWGKAKTDPLYLKGEVAAFEYVIMPMG